MREELLAARVAIAPDTLSTRKKIKLLKIEINNLLKLAGINSIVFCSMPIILMLNAIIGRVSMTPTHFEYFLWGWGAVSSGITALAAINIAAKDARVRKKIIDRFSETSPSPVKWPMLAAIRRFFIGDAATLTIRRMLEKK